MLARKPSVPLLVSRRVPRRACGARESNVAGLSAGTARVAGHRRLPRHGPRCQRLLNRRESRRPPVVATSHWVVDVLIPAGGPASEPGTCSDGKGERVTATFTKGVGMRTPEGGPRSFAGGGSVTVYFGRRQRRRLHGRPRPSSTRPRRSSVRAPGRPTLWRRRVWAGAIAWTSLVSTGVTASVRCCPRWLLTQWPRPAHAGLPSWPPERSPWPSPCDRSPRSSCCAHSFWGRASE
jgi:hypothetical protein